MFLNKKKLLDCTLRDGGYYNNWQFSTKLVNTYLECIKNSGIDIIEIGFRFKEKKPYYGKFAYTTDKFLESLVLPKNLSYGVMINAKEFINNESELKKFFQPKHKSPIDLVRVAVNVHDYYKCKKICEFIKEKNYILGLNLMQSHDLHKNQYLKISKDINSWKLIDVLYFADSLGCMNNNEVADISKILVKNFKGPVGIHAHDNKGLALSNTLLAINNGVQWFDSTITGMGRGAGNTKTEHLVVECNHRKLIELIPSKLAKVVKDFSNLKNKYKWGTNLYYHLGAINKIHPTYIQNILNDDRYNKNTVIEMIEAIKKLEPEVYKYDVEEKAYYKSSSKIIKGNFNAKDFYKDKEIILIGSGNSLIHNKEKILNYLKKNKNKLVFYLNNNKYLNNFKAEGIFACNDSRLLSDYKNYLSINTKLIIPKKNYKKIINNKKLDIFDYALNLGEKPYLIYENFCIIKWPLAIAYALSFLTIANVKKIFLIGFDGYEENTNKNFEMISVFNEYNKLKNKKDIISLTETKYKIMKKIII